MEEIKKYINAHRDIFVYLFFGICTTTVNYIVFFPLYNCLGVSVVASNIAAWIIAVIFAYITNKIFVFHSSDWSPKTMLPEFGKFIACRIGSVAVETAIIYVATQWLTWNGNITKILTGIIVIILNFFGSRFLVFHK